MAKLRYSYVFHLLSLIIFSGIFYNRHNYLSVKYHKSLKSSKASNIRSFIFYNRIMDILLYQFYCIKSNILYENIIKFNICCIFNKIISNNNVGAYSSAVLKKLYLFLKLFILRIKELNE